MIFLRPWWWLVLPFLVILLIIFWQKKSQLSAWAALCDPNLLAYLLPKKRQPQRLYFLSLLFLSALFMICSLSGPAWYQLPVKTYKSMQAGVLLLDMSQNILQHDLSPNRLIRAKFKLRDLCLRKDIGQLGLIAFTSEPFVVSPLTDDGNTIASLLPSLTPEIMPVEGQNLAEALVEAKKMMTQAGYQQGKILVLTADTPSFEAMEMARSLAQSGISSSIMPVRADKKLNPLFLRFAQDGSGALLRYTLDSSDLEQWIHAARHQRFILSKEEHIPVWRDEGRWFLIPALLFLLPLFQRGRCQRMYL